MTDVVDIARANGIFILTFDRAASRNALSVELAKAIVAALAEADGDPAVRGIVLTGAGDRAFCAGVDLVEAQAVTPDRVEGWFATVCAVYRQIVMADKPVIAALNGVAAGAGFQIALAADLRVAHAGVRMGQPEINAGIPSIMGGHWMGLHLGRSIVQDLSLTGRLMEAAEAERLGLINRMVGEGDVVPAACALATELAAKPGVAWARTKARFREQALARFDAAFRAAVEGQREAFEKGEPQGIMEGFFKNRGGGG
jgi:enoyl-CoA hydratase/carnithine racemase